MFRKNQSLFLCALSALSLNAAAGTMGGIAISNYLLLEAGGSYTHSFYKDNVVTAESFTTLTPYGVSIHPGDFYPNNFWGGYVGLSWLRNDSWLFNVRYDMYGSDSEYNPTFNTRIELAPVKLSFTADKVFGTTQGFSFGPGAGVVIATNNQGRALTGNTHILSNGDIAEFVQGESLQGRNRIDPLVEAFAMYHLTDSFNVRLNVAYQIPVHSFFTNGSLNTNLGINYQVPV